MNRREFLKGAACLGALPLCGCNDSDSSGPPLPVTDIQGVLDRSVGGGVPGIVFGVRSPRGTFFGAAGTAEIETGRPMTSATQIRLASVTKTLTAGLILALHDADRLSVHDPLDRWLPGIVANSDRITLAHLLNHTAGVYDHENDPGLDILSDEGFTRDHTTDEILAIVRAHGADFDPGAKWSYSNAGYYLLGLVAERAAGAPLESEIEHRLFAPLGMTRTSLTRRGALMDPFTGGYCLLPDGSYRNMAQWNMSWDWTAGSAASIARDMVTWIWSLCNGRVLTPATFAFMTAPEPVTTHIRPGISGGHGLTITASDPVFGERMFSHDGANGGTHTKLQYFPDTGRALFLGVNRFDYGAGGPDVMALAKQTLLELGPLVR